LVVDEVVVGAAVVVEVDEPVVRACPKALEGGAGERETGLVVVVVVDESVVGTTAWWWW
jgi:hypothetical protein